MRSYTLNGRRSMNEPVQPGIPLPSGRVIVQPSTRANSLEEGIEKVKKYYEAGKKIQEAGQSDGSELNYGAALAAITAGAAAGSALPGVGTIAGAVVGAVIYVVSFLTGPRPSLWVDAAPGVHTWFTNYGAQEFLDWLDNTGQGRGFQSVEAAARAQVMYWLSTYSYVLVPGGSIYSGILDDVYISQVGGGAVLDAMYRDIGIDYPATVELRMTVGSGIMFLNRTFVPKSNEEAADDVTPPADNGSSMSTGEKVGIGVGVAALLLVIAKQ